MISASFSNLTPTVEDYIRSHVQLHADSNGIGAYEWHGLKGFDPGRTFLSADSGSVVVSVPLAEVLADCELATVSEIHPDHLMDLPCVGGEEDGVEWSVDVRIDSIQQAGESVEITISWQEEG